MIESFLAILFFIAICIGIIILVSYIIQWYVEH